MAYFAKYLPVPKEVIKDGDLIEHPTTRNRMTATKDMGLGYLTVNTDWNKLKLFLCSRDIQAGDKAYDTGHNDGIARLYVPSLTDALACDEATVSGNTEGLFKVIGEISPEAVWVKEGDEFEEAETSYNSQRVKKIEELRLDFEKRTGLGLGSWVKDSEDGYKERYQGTIYDYDENGGDLQIMYGCIGTFGGSTWGWEKDIIPMKGGNGNFPRPVTYGKHIIKIKCPTCKHFH